MYKALVQQPTIFRPVWRKGVHYFDMGYEHDLDWYRAHFPLEAQLKRAAKKHGTRALAFESSPYYLFHPLAADRIAASLPDVSVIVLVRDPRRACLLGLGARARTRVRDTGLRGRARRGARAAPPARWSACWPTRRTAATPTATRPIAPAASTHHSSSGWQGSSDVTT